MVVGYGSDKISLQYQITNKACLNLKKHQFDMLQYLHIEQSQK